MGNNDIRMVQHISSDPTAIGQFGLSMVTLVAASQKLGWTNGLGVLVPVAFFLGGVAQLYAGIMDSKHNKSFGANVFTCFGIFWMTMAIAWMIKSGVFGEVLAKQYDVKQLGFFFLGYLIFSLFATAASLEATKQLFIAFILVDLLLIGLTLESFGIAAHFAHQIAAWSELIVSLVCFYGVGGYVINSHLGFVLLPMGKPTGILRKLNKQQI